MSVLIKGMEMPENCNKCRFQSELRLYCDAMPYNFCGNTDDIKRPDWCPLIEIPTPHGRLIDADELWDKMYNYIDNEGAKMPFGDNDFMIHRDSACELIEDATTVIEAEGSKT